MDAYTYLNIQGRLAHYECMRATAPARQEVGSLREFIRTLVKAQSRKTLVPDNDPMFIAPIGNVNG